MFTIRDLKAAIRKPGKVWVPVLSKHDVTHFTVIKTDFIAELGPDGDPSPWTVSSFDGDHWLDVNDDA